MTVVVFSWLGHVVVEVYNAACIPVMYMHAKMKFVFMLPHAPAQTPVRAGTSRRFIAGESCVCSELAFLVYPSRSYACSARASPFVWTDAQTQSYLA